MASTPQGWKFGEQFARRIINQVKLAEKRGPQPDRSTTPRRGDDPPYFFAIVVDSGPSGAPALTKSNTAWFKRAYLDNDDSDTQVTPAKFTAFDDDDPWSTWDCVTLNSPGVLLIGQPIIVWWGYDQSDTPTVRYFTESGVRRPSIQIVSNADGAEVYHVNLIKPGSSGFNPGDAATLASIGTPDTSTTAYALNRNGIGYSGHSIAEGSIWGADILNIDDDGIVYLEFDGIGDTACSTSPESSGE